jgi:hypothetical protein
MKSVLSEKWMRDGNDQCLLDRAISPDIDTPFIPLLLIGTHCSLRFAAR